MTSMPTSTRKAYLGAPLEGRLAIWYAKQTKNLTAEFEAEASAIAGELPPRARVLEVAPGPGYLAVAIARLGAFEITGLDISHTFVRIAAENAARAGVAIAFAQGNAAAMPFEADAFDFIVCRAAFKNFADPLGALAEMHRVLRPRGWALIRDMRSDATTEALDAAVGKMHLGFFNSFVTRRIFRGLRKKAYSRNDFLRMAAATPFGDANVVETDIGLDVRLRKSATEAVD